MKGAIIGHGFIAEKGHFPSYLQMKDLQIVAVADITPERLQRAKEIAPWVRTYTDHRTLLDAERDLDFVGIATPPHVHSRIAIDALDRGISVLCEKPLAISSAEVLEMANAARRNNTVIFPVHNYKHAPVVKKLSSLLHAGEIGSPRSCTLGTYRTTHAIGASDFRAHWRREKILSGGGIAMDHGSHSFYLTFMFMKGYPQSVSATTFKQIERFDTEDSVTCMLRFPDGFADVYLSWTAGVRKVTYSIQGERGALFVDEDNLQIGNGRRIRSEKIRSEFGDASHVSWFKSLFEQFHLAIKSKDYVGQEMKDAYYCVRLIEKIYESNDKGSLEIPLEPELDELEGTGKIRLAG